ncbi:MAG: hypothetical protein CVU72_01455 [Deltaproteobacteria bacterium HGW-Deltaproteobacteria-7]|jgi:hypothetical protein|nr:MAG: hypothetical protein CVU72_01455 [Deltaproteobacteria bacterium HGW-Deltaproteobacteria-7]PKN52073.1 MAG: hypothetical protein CVU55_08435 [Deltaproteobacteria bacterium HGW-Deltaproteobacteria-13]
MNLIEEIKLDNGLTLKIFDLSRSIAADTVKVEVSFQTKISLKESYFADIQDYNQVKDAMGDELAYERNLERSFVHKQNEDSVRDDLINTFKSNSLDYLASANFPQKMALSLLRDIKKNPYKYNPHIYTDSEE